MHHRSPRAALFLVAATIGLLAGCGTSSGSDASSDGSTTSAASDAATTTEGSDTTAAEGAATTTTEAAATTTEAADDDGICGPLKALNESDADANALVATGDWTKIKAFYVDQTDDIVAIYDAAIAFDSEITDDLETLRSVTVSAGDLAEQSTSLMDFSAKLTSQPGLAESSSAALRANDFAKETCGFALAGF